MVSIFVKNLSVTYQDRQQKPVRALEDIDLSIREGEFLTVVGPSGAGKSSLLRLIAGLEKPSSGQVLYGTEPVVDIPLSNRGVAILFQDAPLYPDLPVCQNLELPLKRAGLSNDQIEAKVGSFAKRFRVEHRMDRLSDQLSKGERQRVALVRALLHEPKILLLDEPLVGLDPELRFLLRREILSWQQQTGATVICVTHEPFDGFTMGNRVAVMDHGRVQQVDAPDRVSEYPANKFVAGFISYPPMNFFRGSISAGSVGSVGPVFKGEIIDKEGVTFNLAVPSPMRNMIGRSVVVGIRPGDIQFESRTSVLENDFEAEVRRVDRFEDVVFVELACGGETLVVRDQSEQAPTINQRLRVSVSTDRCVWFDGETLERIG